MASNYKTVKNGRGTSLQVSDKNYITVGPNGTDIAIRGNKGVAFFNCWDDLVNAINFDKASWSDVNPK